MKNILLFLLGSFCATQATAQPILTAPTMNPVVGDIFYGHDQGDTTGISKGPSGPGVTWNLAFLDSSYTDTTLYQACASTPYCDSFPGSTLATFDGYEYFYYVADAAKFAASGVGEDTTGGGGCIYYPNQQTFGSYPNTYNTVSADSFYEAQPAAQYYSYGLDSFIADAYGTLILPSGTFNNVLRVHIISYETDSFNLTGGFPDAITYRTESYFWYQNGFHNPLLIMSYDTSAGLTYLSDAEYYTAPPSVPVDTSHTAVASILSTGSELQVYPNPANDAVHIKFNSPANQTIAVSTTDVMGRSVVQSNKMNISEGTNDVSYNVANLPPGMYFIKIQSANNTYINKVQIER